VLLFSATLDGAVGKLAAAVQRRPVRHEVGPAGPDIRAARHLFWAVPRPERTQLTADVVGRLGSTMVFCRTRHGADRLARQLAKLGVTAAPIHGGRSQPQRDRALKAFATGAVSTLVATDVAARGVHVDDVAAVVHYDLPADAATYVHRSGRTARAGASGVVVSLVEAGLESDARTLRREVGIEGASVRPSLADLSATRPAPAPAPASTPAPAAASSASAAPDAGRGRSGRRSGTRRLVGTVSFFHDRRGYGFIDAGRSADVFVHRTNISGTSVPLTTGARVEFAIRDGQRGAEAVDVVAV
jgi:superfamily II DNA/RNA helicase